MDLRGGILALSVVIPAIALLCRFLSFFLSFFLFALLGFSSLVWFSLWCIGRGILMRLCHSLLQSVLFDHLLHVESNGAPTDFRKISAGGL